jgi:hypothetical protein
VRDLLAQAVDVGLALGELVDQWQRTGVVGLDAAGDLVDDDLPLRPQLAEVVVDRPRRRARVTMRQLGKR